MVDDFRGDIFVGQRGEELAESFGFRHGEDVLMVIVPDVGGGVPTAGSNCGPRSSSLIFIRPYLTMQNDTITTNMALAA